MTTSEAKREAVRLLMEKADDALRAARLVQSESPATAVNRAYYACFYAASAVLITEGRHFVKHTGVRSALHQHLVKTGRVSPEIGKIYDSLTISRQKADYESTAIWTPSQAAKAIESAERVVAALRGLLASDWDAITP